MTHSEYMKRHYEENREKLEKTQRVITMARRERGLTQEKLAKKLYVCTSTLSRYENGTAPARWDLLEAVMPELKELREKGCEAYCRYPQPCLSTGRCGYRQQGGLQEGF